MNLRAHASAMGTGVGCVGCLWNRPLTTYVCAQRGPNGSHEHARIPWALGAPVGPTQHMDSHGAHSSMDPHGARGTRGSLGPHVPHALHGSSMEVDANS